MSTLPAGTVTFRLAILFLLQTISNADEFARRGCPHPSEFINEDVPPRPLAGIFIRRRVLIRGRSSP